MITKFYTYTALFEKEPGTDDTYNVSIPALPGCLTFGESKKEAEYMIQDALNLYLECLIDDGESIPANIPAKSKKKDSYTKDVVVGLKQEVVTGYPAHETPHLALT